MINSRIRTPWPEEVAKALDDVRQGDVVEKPPFFYAHGGKVRLWELPQDAEDDLTDDELLSQVEELHPDDGPALGIVTSQTCDIEEQGPPFQPWLQVSPVYPLPQDVAEANRMLSKQSVVEINGPDLPDGRWIADLRIDFPVEKSWLVGRKTYRGFDSEDEAERFGLRLGRRRARPALANALVETITGTLRERKKSKKGKGTIKAVWAQVYRVMLDVEQGNRLTPVAVRLHVIAVETPQPDVKDWFESWEDDARQAAGAEEIDLLATHFHDARKIDLRDYDRWVELDFT